ncbi:hypothetical protein K440DRAFT_644020 [Wilcoxina mikolae CBS 423.85]|nr:hypothetical protein K440DRAFT_644020 [Wilcoxina mikolae CBS 423.85]
MPNETSRLGPISYLVSSRLVSNIGSADFTSEQNDETDTSTLLSLIYYRRSFLTQVSTPADIAEEAQEHLSTHADKIQVQHVGDVEIITAGKQEGLTFLTETTVDLKSSSSSWFPQSTLTKLVLKPFEKPEMAMVRFTNLVLDVSIDREVLVDSGTQASSLVNCAELLHTIPISKYVLKIQNGDVNTFTYLTCIEILAVQVVEGWVPMVECVPIYTGLISLLGQ